MDAEEKRRIKRELTELLDAKARLKREHFIDTLYPDKGELRRELYPKHTAFFTAGKDYTERAVVAANRIGKSLSIGGYETAVHLTGEYPEWWDGYRFDHPISAWAAGQSNMTVRDIIQLKLLGPINDIGTGLIPKACMIGKPTMKSGVPNAIESVQVRHALTGGVSTLSFKSYEMGRQAFEGTERDLIWLDEEPPMDVYGECLVRTMTTNGHILCTFTPLEGLSDVVLSYMPGGRVPDEMGSKFVIQAGWDDAPHLTSEQRQKIIDGTMPHLRDARSKGIPQLGAGAVYPISEDDILVDDFEVPIFWPRVYALDVGWNKTAALWGAWDRENDIVYLYSEYYRGHAEPPVHSNAIGSRGTWIPGVADPHSGDSSQRDGMKLLHEYQDLLEGPLFPADNAVEAGVFAVWRRLSSGRLKVFRSLVNWTGEFRIYRRDENGKIVKKDDHLQDCFHADTEVITRHGPRKIRSLVGTEGEVLSLEGKYEKYQNCACYGRRKRVVEVAFDNGSSVVCTPDHRFLTPHGWCVAIDLAGKDVYNGIANTIQGGDLCKLRSYLNPSNSFWGKRIGFAVDIFSVMGLGCIGASGDTITGKSQKASVYTIKTAIGLITKLATYFSYLSPAMFRFTRLATNEGCLLTRLKPPRNGTHPPREGRGIKNIMMKWGTFFTGKPNLSAKIAERFMSAKKPEQIGFAQTRAGQRGAEKVEWTTKLGSAGSAVQSSASTSTLPQKPVPRNALLKSWYVKEAGKADVYCLEVPKTRTFILANGAAVHNCTRYLTMSGLQVAAVGPLDELYEDEIERARDSVNKTTGY